VLSILFLEEFIFSICKCKVRFCIWDADLYGESLNVSSSRVALCVKFVIPYKAGPPVLWTSVSNWDDLRDDGV